MKTIDVLRKHSSPDKSKWRKEAEWRRDNWCWLRYSTAIALSVRQRMKDLGMTQVALAEKLGCTQQHVSMLLKGDANLTLETIARLECALDFSILSDSLSLVDGYSLPSGSRSFAYLNDPSADYVTKK